MKHCMAIWANRAQFLFRIAHVLFSYLAKRLKMVYMNKSIAYWTVCLSKVKRTYDAFASPLFNTCSSGL